MPARDGLLWYNQMGDSTTSEGIEMINRTHRINQTNPGTAKRQLFRHMRSFVVGVGVLMLVVYFISSQISTDDSATKVASADTNQPQAPQGIQQQAPQEPKQSQDSGNAPQMSAGSMTKESLAALDLKLPVPANILEAAKTINLQKLIIKVGSANINYVTGDLPSGVALKPVQILLLHGAAFSSQNWIDIKTIHELTAAGFKTYAVNIPGSRADSSQTKISPESDLVKGLISGLGLTRAVIVSPSMSGSFALPYLKEYEQGAGTGKVAGYIPVAPAGASGVTAAEYQQIKIPSLLVYGSKDSSGAQTTETLAQLPISRKFMIEDASHPAYIDKPEVWHNAIYNFLNNLK